MLPFLIVTTILTSISKCHSEDAGVLSYGSIEKERKTHCKEAICQITCLPLHCRNEYIKPKHDVKVVPESEFKSVDVYCTDALSCAGKIKINGGDGIIYNWHSRIFCGEDQEACHGGIYAIKSSKIAVFRGNAKESTIIFKENSNAIVSTVDLKSEEEDFRFFMNNVWIDKCVYFKLFANQPNSVVASVFHLDRPKVHAEMNCNAFGSCNGAIFIFNKCGSTRQITCKGGACQLLNIFVLQSDCTTTQPVKIIIDKKEEDPPTNILVWCQHTETKQVKSAKGDVTSTEVIPDKEIKFESCILDATVHGTQAKHSDEGIKIFLKKKDFVEEKNKQLNELKKGWDKKAYETKRKSENNLQWVLDKHNYKYFAGVTLEAAYGTLAIGSMTAVASVGTSMILLETGLIAGGLSVLGAVGVGVPVLAPLIIPGVIFAGMWYHHKRKKQRKSDRWDVRSNSAKQGYNDYLYDDDDDEEYDDYQLIEQGGSIDSMGNFHLDDNGYIISYDIFTGIPQGHDTHLVESMDEIVYNGESSYQHSYNGARNDYNNYMDPLWLSGAVMLAFVFLCVSYLSICIVSYICGYGTRYIQNQQRHKYTTVNDIELGDNQQDSDI